MTEKNKKQKSFRCAACGEGTVYPVAKAGRQARYRTLTLPVPATLEIPTCDHCGTEWIGDTVAEALDTALDAEYRRRMRDLVTAAMDRLAESDIPKASVERLLGLAQGYLSHLTTTGDKTPSEALALDLALLAQDPRRVRFVEELWKKLSGAKPDLAGALPGRIGSRQRPGSSGGRPRRRGHR
jgi:hypothetical protein